MQIQFNGAARAVTGSKHLLTLSKGTRVLLDCGIFQGKKNLAQEINSHWGFDPASIDFLLLSHAHIDHCGLIPKLVKDGFKGKIYCTYATYDLCKIMLPDSAHIQEDDAFFANKRRLKEGLKLIEPLYTTPDAEKSLTYFFPVKFETRIQEEEFSFSFHENGHLLGSGGIWIESMTNGLPVSLYYTGDIGRRVPHLLRRPQPFPPADYVICESTYGDRLHEDDAYLIQDVVDMIHDTCVRKKGKLIIPAFSIGRTQEIIYALDYLTTQKKLPPVKVYVDSPLSTKGTAIFKEHLDLFNREFREYLRTDSTPFDFPNLHFIESVEESKRLNFIKEPCVIISASGMMDAGRVRHHIFNSIENPNNAVLIVGYCEPSTLGGKLIAGVKRIKMYGQELNVNARVEYIRSYSGHADYNEMIQYLSGLKKKEVKNLFLVHGEYEVQERFKTILTESGFPQVTIPDKGETFSLI